MTYIIFQYIGVKRFVFYIAPPVQDYTQSLMQYGRLSYGNTMGNYVRWHLGCRIFSDYLHQPASTEAG